MTGVRSIRVIAPALVAFVALLLATSASADYEQVGNFAEGGEAAQLEGVRDMAVNATGAGGVEPGSVYAGGGGRVLRYGPAGEFKEAWGYGVIKSGPDIPDGVQAIKVSATSGSYRLTAITARWSGTFEENSNQVTLTEELGIGTLHVGDELQPIPGKAFLVPPGTTITAIDSAAHTLELSAVSGHHFEGGQFYGAETTAPIQATATSAEVESALLSLEGPGPGDISVAGGPGDSEGSSPYQVTFEGAYAGQHLTPTLTASNISLVGGNPASSVNVTTLFDPSALTFERCRIANGDICEPQVIGPGYGPGNNYPEGVGNFRGPYALTVDQQTGYVYVRNDGGVGDSREHNLIEVFSADGSEVIDRFGDAGPESETFDEGPAKLHSRLNTGRQIAVDPANGTLYVTDNNQFGHRVMCFRPQVPEEYEHYVYCGRSADIDVNLSLSLEAVSLDDSGHIYLGAEELIEELSLADPAAPPICTFNTKAQAIGITVNPVTGEVFYFVGSNNRSVHVLKPCDPGKGKFEEAQTAVKVSPGSKGIRAMAINPNFAWGPGRPDGALYAADTAEHEIEQVNPKTQKMEKVKQYGIGDIFAPAELHNPPVIESESVSDTRTASAILHAEIDPRRHATHYIFQYLSEAEFDANPPSNRFAGAKEAPLGGAGMSGSSIGRPAVAVSGLAPDTGYRFRAVATSECDGHGNELCVGEGEPIAFATYPSYPVGLPDHRAYELVSPAQKDGGEVVPLEPNNGSCGNNCKPSSFGLYFPVQSAPDGEALAYQGQPFTRFEGPTGYDSYIARRTASGWKTSSMLGALAVGTVQEGFDPSLEHGVLSVGQPAPNLGLQSTDDPGVTTALVTGGPHYRSSSGPDAISFKYGGHSADLSRVFFSANDSLVGETAFAPEPPDPGVSKWDLYEWHAGRLAMVNVLPGNEAIAAGPSFAALSPDTNAVSADGSVVFFKDGSGRLYARESAEATREIDDPGQFLSASPDGAEVLLRDGCLYSMETESCTDLTAGEGGFQGLVGQSTDLSHIYFVDTAVLARNQGAALESDGSRQLAESGEDNLYEWTEEGTHFIARLLAEDNQREAGINAYPGDWAPNPADRTAEASLNGRFLAFNSKAELTRQDNLGCSKPLHPTEIPQTIFVPAACAEVFLYDSATGKLSCATCSPTKELPLADTLLPRRNGAEERLPQPRYLTDEGRLYFSTADSLASRDTNQGVEDVYEFEPAGSGADGTCGRPDGCALLMSAGTGTVDSNVIAVDETGKNVFFDTRDQLVLKDKDELLDIYDAREGGGIAAETEVARAECQGEGCQPPASPPIDPTPGSSSLVGAGNVNEGGAGHPKKKQHRKYHKAKHKKWNHKKRHQRHHARPAKHNRGGAQ